MHKNLIIFLLSFISLSAHAADTDVDLLKLLKPLGEPNYERQGWIFNQEAEKDWLQRLAKNPPSIERVIVHHSPLGRWWEDYSVLICFNRPFQKVEFDGLDLRYLYSYSLAFADGSEITKEVDYYNNFDSYDFYRSKTEALENRCFEISETDFHPGKRWDPMTPGVDKKFRNDSLQNVSFTMYIKGKYGQKEVSTISTSELPFISDKTMPIYEGSVYKGEKPITDVYMHSRSEGEFFALSMRCENVELATRITPPEELDKSPKAIAFADGFDHGKRAIAGMGTCNDVLLRYGPNGYEIPGIFKKK